MLMLNCWRALNEVDECSFSSERSNQIGGFDFLNAEGAFTTSLHDGILNL